MIHTDFISHERWSLKRQKTDFRPNGIHVLPPKVLQQRTWCFYLKESSIRRQLHHILFLFKMALVAFSTMWYGKYFLLFPPPYLLKKGSIHTHSGLSDYISGCTTRALRDDENNVSCELCDLLEEKEHQWLLWKSTQPFTTFQLEMRKGTWPAVFILTTIPAEAITMERINTGLKLHLNPATCSNAYYVQLVRWDTFFQIFTEERKPKVWECFKALVSQQHQQSAKILFCMT